MRLICYPTSGEPPKIVVAPVEREWMERTPGGFAYRCLPLNIANAHGWLILNSAPFVAQWDGSDDLHAIAIEQSDTDSALLAQSHFGCGVLTFGINGLFRTEPGYDLWVTGPVNTMKDAIQPLTGVVETDWSPFTFTMNWKFTRKLTPVAFERDEPICMIFPLPRGLLEAVDPEFRPIEQDKEVNEAYLTWSKSRQSFNTDLKVTGSEAARQGWQKDYFRGTTSRWGSAPPDHRVKLKLKPFT